MGFNIVSEVRTKETSCTTGERYSEWSEESVVTAPEGHVINDREVKISWESAYGSENTYSQIFEDYVEILPGTGLKYPKTMKVKAFARSPKGRCSGRGSSKVRFEGEYIKYQ